MKLYIGHLPDGPYQLSNDAMNDVKKLITPDSGKGRNLTTDNWYTNVPLDTFRKNKKEIPPCFTDKGRL